MLLLCEYGIRWLRTNRRAGPANHCAAYTIHDFEVQGFSLIGFVIVYGVSGQRMACAVIIVIYHDCISIVYVLSQVLRSCTELYQCREPFLCPPRAVPLDLQSNLVAEACHWVLGQGTAPAIKARNITNKFTYAIFDRWSSEFSKLTKIFVNKKCEITSFLPALTDADIRCHFTQIP